MRTKTLYICGICDCVYQTQSEAELCEKMHKNIDDVVSVEAGSRKDFYREIEGYPAIVNVRFTDGSVIPYEFGQRACRELERMHDMEREKKDSGGAG